MNKPDKQTLRELAKLFLKLGTIGFGGPAAHIAMMQEEVVKKRKWMNEQHFLNLIGATNLIPGPNGTEMAIHIGHERAGWKGLIVAGMCFILPFAIVSFSKKVKIFIYSQTKQCKVIFDRIIFIKFPQYAIKFCNSF